MDLKRTCTQSMPGSWSMRTCGSRCTVGLSTCTTRRRTKEGIKTIAIPSGTTGLRILMNKKTDAIAALGNLGCCKLASRHRV